MLNANNVQRVVIAGGGTAGWLAAAGISRLLGAYLDITLVESDEIGTVGVGEATIPTMLAFHKLLGINEREFLQATNATFKLGINFENWGQVGDKYLHAFGKVGKICWAGEFQHFWLKGRELGVNFPFGDYCLEHQAALAGKFAVTQNPHLNYAYHLDASLYAGFLRKFSESFGAKRIEGKIVEVIKNSNSGYIEAIKLASGHLIEGDLFIDCTGFRGLLIEEALQTGYEDWSRWLPCDRAVAVQTRSTEPPLPYTRAMAHDVGWQWRIPLRNRIGNGLVYASRYLADEEAKVKLLANLDGEPLTEPRLIKFFTGKRKQGWNKNCVAMGLASGFIEPLESTSIHLVTSAVVRLLRLFPTNGIRQIQIDEYNHQYHAEIDSVRDFIVLHYNATQRNDSEFWRYLGLMDIPDTLAHRIKLFEQTGLTFIGDGDLFHVDSWTQVMIGQGIIPEAYHSVAQAMGDRELIAFLKGFRAHIDKNVGLLPAHADFVKRYCDAMN